MGKENKTDRLLTPAEVGAIFQVDPKTVARWALEGRLAHQFTPGGHRRYRQSDIDKLLAELRVERTR